MNLGTHWPDPKAVYPPAAPTVDLCYLTAPKGGVFSAAAAMKRLEVYAATHPDATVVLRVDWGKAAHSFPLEADLPGWRDGLQSLHYLAHLGSRLVIQIGNEPQLEGAQSIDQVVTAWMAAAEMLREVLPDALIGSVPIAPYNPDRMGAPEGGSPEGSPWADLDMELNRRLWDHHVDRLRPDVDLRHVYGDGSHSVKDDAENVTDEGWRFGINVAHTWRETRESLGIWSERVIVTEFNTAARGVSPQGNYRAGWLPDALLYLRGALPTCSDLCWFVGSVTDYGDLWSAYAVDSSPALQADFTACL